MKTLIGAANPSSNDQLVMIVESTPEQRPAWDEACCVVHSVQRYFVTAEGVLRRLAEGFPVAGVILDRDRNASSRITDAQCALLERLEATGYRGPLVLANAKGSKALQTKFQQLAKSLDTRPLIDDGQSERTYADMLGWCLYR